MAEVLKQVLYFLKSNIARFMLLLVVFAGVNTIIGQVLWEPQLESLDLGLDSAPPNLELGALSRYMFALFVVNLLLQVLLIVKLEAINSGDSDARSSALSTVFSVFLPVLLGNIIIACVCLLGLTLFIVPGVYLFVRLCMFDIIMVLKRPPVLTTLAMSMSLTRGISWNLFIIILASFVFFGLTTGILSNITDGLGGAAQSFGNELLATIGSLFWLTVRYRYYLLNLDQLKPGDEQ